MRYLKIKIGCIFKEKERYLDTKGFTSWDLRLTDSYYYQTFSYRINSTIPSVEYNEVVDDLLHPVGTQRFSTWNYNAVAPINVSIGDSESVNNVSTFNVDLVSMTSVIPAVITMITPIVVYLDPMFALVNVNPLKSVDENKFDSDFSIPAEYFESYSENGINNPELSTYYGHDVIINIET